MDPETFHADDHTYDTYDYALGQADFEAMAEAEQWRAHEEVEQFVDWHYPFAKGWRREELVEAGEDALSAHEQWGFSYELETRCMDGLVPTPGALRDLRGTLAAKWREQCEWRRQLSFPVCPVVASRASRAAPRPRAHRYHRRRRAASRDGPDGDPDLADLPGARPRGGRASPCMKRSARDRRGDGRSRAAGQLVDNALERP